MSARALSAWSLSALVITLSSGNPVYRALVAVAALNVILALRRPEARVGTLLRAVVLAGVVATIVTFVVSHSGAHVLFALPPSVPVLGGPFTVETLLFGMLSGLAIAAAVLAVAPLSLVVHSHELVDALPVLLTRTGAVVATAVNVLPALARSATEIREAQQLRGVRVRSLTGVADTAVPVVLTAVEDSMRLAEAMEARGYGSRARTHYSVARGRPAGAVVAALSLGAAAAFVALHVTGAVADWYPFPALTPPAVSPAAVACCLALCVPAVLRRG